MSGVSRRSILVGTAGGVLGTAASRDRSRNCRSDSAGFGTAPVGSELGDRADSSHRRGR